MLVLGLQGSPRRKGNTNYLLDCFLQTARTQGAVTECIDTEQRNIVPCKEYTVCEKKGTCPIKDDMAAEIYGLIREADVIVAATPVFFYNMSAQLKALVDRCQLFWARKYLLKLRDPGAKIRQGFLLSAAATRGQHLFDAIELSIKYFFDAVDAGYAGSLNYRGIEARGEMPRHPTAAAEVRQAAESIVAPLAGRRRILFACRENACRSQMAAAFARLDYGDCIDAISAGSEPVDKVNPDMQKAMAELGIDTGQHFTRGFEAAIERHRPEIVVTMGCKQQGPNMHGVQMIDWDLADPAGESPQVMRTVRDRIRKNIANLADSL